MNFRNLLLGAAVATAAMSLGAAANATAPNTQTATVTGAAKIIRPITISATGTLDFGTIVKPRTGGTNGVVTISNAVTAARTMTGDLVAVGSTFSRPVYTIGGEGGQTYNLTVPASFTLTGPASSTITVTLNPSMTVGTNTFSGATLGNGDTATLYMGASIPVADTTTTGAYTGTYDVTVTYN